jgi:hypothetical protein
VTERSGPQAFRELQARARNDGRGTEELLVLYAHEGFLRRLSQSSHHRALVLKGGMLMAVLHARRPTRDADLSVHGLPGDETSVRRFITEIASVSTNDGLEFDTTKITTAAMRADAEYHGVRVAIPAALATARIKVQLDLSHASTRQSAWTALRLRSALTTLPASFEEVVAEVVRFVDPLVERNDDAGTWLPQERRWSTEPDA